MTGIELEEVHRVLVECFNPNSFAFFLRTKMDKVLDHIAGRAPFSNVVFEVLSVAEQEGWDSLLIARVAEVRPHQRDALLLAQEVWASPGRAVSGRTPATHRPGTPIANSGLPRRDSRLKPSSGAWKS